MSHLRHIACIAIATALLATAVGAADSIAGKWDVVWDTEGGVRTQQWSIAVDGDSVTLTTSDTEFSGTFKDGRLTFGGEFYSAGAGYKAQLKVEGVYKDGRLTGSGTWDQYAMTFTATRAE